MNLPTKIIGIDPGLTGAIAVYSAGEEPSLTSVWDMPVEAKATKGNRIDAGALIHLFTKLGITDEARRRTCIAVVEQVGAMPGQGVTSMFNFGEGCGVLRCALVAAHIPYVYVSPNKWKKMLGLTGREKEFALTRARELMPEAAQFLTRKKDVGRADASLIAYWAYTFHGKTP